MLKVPRGGVAMPFEVLEEALAHVFSRPVVDGPAIGAFETTFARMTHVRHAVAVPSGKMALLLLLQSIGVGEGDEVILPSYIVEEVVDIILATGAIPVFVDIDPETHNIDADGVPRRITPRTKVLLAPHMYGQPCDMSTLLSISEQHDITMLEDCAQACGAEYDGRPVGGIGHAGYFSFGLMKNLMTLGGSMVTTDDEAIAASVRRAVSSFRPPRIHDIVKLLVKTALIAGVTHPLGFSLSVFPFLRLLGERGDAFLYDALRYEPRRDIGSDGSVTKLAVRYTNLQAAIGLSQLPYLTRSTALRMRNAGILYGLLEGAPVERGETIPHVRHIHTNYVVKVDDRDELKAYLRKRGIDATNGYIPSCADLPRFERYHAPCPASRNLAQRNVYLPISPSLTREQVVHVGTSTRHWLERR